MPTARIDPEARWPPPISPDETNEERDIRLEQEREAKHVSDGIDFAINNEREAQKKNPYGAKILLLGQAESGKSTILKNFQLHFSPAAFHSEAILWRPVIHLNLVRSVNFILKVVSPRSASGTSSPTSAPLNDTIRRSSFSLAPLKSVELSLTKQISGSPSPVVLDNSSSADTPFTHYHPAKAPEISIRSGVGWKGLLKFRRQSGASAHYPEDLQNRRIINACGNDIIALWRDSDVQTRLRDESISLKDQPGFFLEDVERVVKEDYLPTPDDVLRARVSTIGPEEHRITMESSIENGSGSWLIIDVPGDRSQRAAWAQFFDDVTTIIFLAPISAFNQALAEDETVNRLADSMKLWRMLCSNKLLSSVDLILLLNKVDILDAQLKAGIQFSKYVTSYRDKPNETEAVSKYLVDMFTSLHKQHSTQKRKMHPHLTCAIDTKATAAVINHIQELILLKTLTQTNIL